MSFLSKVLVVSALVAAVFSQTTAPPYNNVSANHYVALFNDALYFPYATDVCQPQNLFGTLYAKFTCLSTTTLQSQFYTDASCSTTSGSAIVYTKNTSLSSGSANYFDCSGSDGYYTLVGLSAQTSQSDSAKASACTTSAQQTIAAALQACAPGSNSATTFSVYCDSTHAELQYFYSTTCTTRSIFVQSINASTTCDYLFTSVTTSGTFYIYGQMNTCQLGTTTSTTTSTTTTKKDSSGSIHFSTLSLILSVLAYIIA